MGNNITENGVRLSGAQLEHYHKEGYLIYRNPVFPAIKFQALKDHFEEKIARLPSTIRPEAMDVPHFADPRLFEWLFADEVLDLVESIIGPDIALWSSHFICKPKGDGRRVPWHEDSSYWKGRLDPMEVVTVWLAIDPSTKENGCMNVIPRSLNGFSEYNPVDTKINVFPTEIKANQFEASSAIAIELQPNQASFHDGRLIHGSQPNNSQIRRCGYTMRYMSTRVRMSPEKNPSHLIYLARGRDHAGNAYADPSHAYEELARYCEKKGGNGH